MLFLRRMTTGSPQRFEVVDTDDGKGQIASSGELAQAQSLGIEIKGYGPAPVHRWELYRDENLTPKQLEAKQTGIDVQTVEGMVVEIDVEHGVSPDTRLVLSEYSTRFPEYIYVKGGKIIVVLDDNLEVGANTFADVIQSGWRIDMTQVTRQDIVKSVYSKWYRIVCRKTKSKDFLNESADKRPIIDLPERWEKWKGLLLARKMIE